MNKKKTILLSILVLGIVTPIIALGISYFAYRTGSTPLSPESSQDLVSPNLPAENSKVQTENPRISGNTATLEIGGKVLTGEIEDSENVYDFMKKLRDAHKVNFTDKTYIGMGKFVDSIDGVRGNGDKTWIYYINGKKAEVGVSNYQMKPGDTITWKYEKLLAY